MRAQRTRWIVTSLFFALAMAMVLWPTRPSSASGQDGLWRVWMKTSPCSGRTDWVSVAKENPTYGGGGPYFEVFPNSHAWSTFAEAMAEANALRTSSLFSRYCCRDYSVWQYTQSGKFSVVQGKFGNAGYGWRFVKGDLCCEEAFAEAGLPGACGQEQLEHNTALNGKNLTYYPRPTVQQCQSDCAGNQNCKGFTWIQAGTYNAGDAAMCYLLSEVTGRSTARGHISAVKGDVGTKSSGGTTSGQDDLSGTWNATYQEPTFGQNFRFQMVLSRVAAGKFQGPLDYIYVDRPNLSFKTQATVQITGAGRIHLTYNHPQQGPQQADGTYTRSQMTFGDSANHVTYTRR